MNVKHHTHPSAQCECDTCDLEHSCEGETDIEIAVNPHSGTLVVMEPTDDRAGWLVSVTNHRTDGSLLFGWRAYDNFADACEQYWATAEWAPK